MSEVRKKRAIRSSAGRADLADTSRERAEWERTARCDIFDFFAISPTFSQDMGIIALADIADQSAVECRLPFILAD